MIDGVWGSATAFERQAATDKRTAKLRAEKKAVKAAAAYKAASSAARKGLDELQEAARIANMRRSVEDQQLAEFATSVFALGGGGGFTSRGGGDFGCSPSTKAGCELDVWNEFWALMDDIEEFLNPVPATGPDGREVQIAIVYLPIGGRFPGSGPRPPIAPGPAATSGLAGASYRSVGTVVENPGLTIQGFGGSSQSGHAINQIINRA